ncbi:hypothetical protein [Metallibacterium sp.]|nr:hypothetical protein [Metallibacterium sp.]
MNVSRIAIIAAAALITLMMLAGVRSGFTGFTIATHTAPASTQSA